MSAMRWLTESEVALKAISEAAILLGGDRTTPGQTREKESARDLVTPWDQLVERRVSSILRQHAPCVITEEERAADAALPDEALQRSWWLDPIDGTVNFSQGLPLYGTSLAWMEEARFVVGAALLPATCEMFFTYGDRGVFLNGRAIEREPFTGGLAKALVGATFSSPRVVGRTPAQRAQEYQLFGQINDYSRGTIRLGSALVQLCHVAAGRLQATYGAFAQGWDIGGGLALIAQTGQTVRYIQEPGTTRFHYVAGCPAVVHELTTMFRDLEVKGLNRL